jgi:hypothetical protein
MMVMMTITEMMTVNDDIENSHANDSRIRTDRIKML